MIDKSKFDYHAFYEKQTGKPVPTDFHVHHIDFDRGNNNISNLVAIPSDLHNLYHTLYDSFSTFKPLSIPLPNSPTQNGNGHFEYYANVTSRFYKVYKEVQDFCIFRDWLLGLLPVSIVTKTY